MDLNNLRLSQHVKERYAERIMDRDNKTDVAVFINNNEDKIKNDIMKMIEYGKHIYSGKSVDLYNKQPVDIYLNGTWVIIVDAKKSNVVTLYSIDLGLGDEFNAQYINKLCDKLDCAKNNLSAAQERVGMDILYYEEQIKENETLIADYRKIIKSLEEQNASYKEMIKNINAQVFVADKDVRDVVATMIGKKVF